jgi:5-methylcytosine-specific restriction endonuclease McrA
MSYKRFTQLFFSHDYQTREKMLGQFINLMEYHARIHPQLPRETVSHRRQIPKLIRGEVWKTYHGNSIKGACYCCKRDLDAFDSWNLGHVVSRFHGGADTLHNLRPLCGSCNKSMGTDHLYDFKKRYYPNSIQSVDESIKCP